MSVIDKLMEEADGVGAATHTGQQDVGVPPQLLQALLPRLAPNDRLKVTHLQHMGRHGVSPCPGNRSVECWWTRCADHGCAISDMSSLCECCQAPQHKIFPCGVFKDDEGMR